MKPVFAVSVALWFAVWIAWSGILELRDTINAKYFLQPAQSSSRTVPSRDDAVPSADDPPSVWETRYLAREAESTRDCSDCSGREALLLKVESLKRGQSFLRSIQDYTARLVKQEVVHNELLDPQSMILKCRQEPFSIYLCWTIGDVGREVIYVKGSNEGKMIAHDGGWKSRIPAFHLAPDCYFAMRDARYPATKAGLACLIETMLEVHEQDLIASNFDSCVIDRGSHFDGRPCITFTTKYKSREASPDYRKSVTLIDSEWNLPLQTNHFEWLASKAEISEDQLDELTLIESYSYHDLSLDQELDESTFDPANAQYSFR